MPARRSLGARSYTNEHESPTDDLAGDVRYRLSGCGEFILNRSAQVKGAAIQT
jgi:hypothetical protein